VPEDDNVDRSRHERCEQWAAALAGDRLDAIAAAFAAGGAAPPEVIWDPGIEALQTEPCRLLLRYWQDCRGTAEMPSYSVIDASAMRSARGYILLIEAIDGGRDFRYRVYGSLVASVSGIDLTGRLMTAHHASDYVIDFAVASGRAGRRRRLPLYSLRHPARTEYTRSWERLQLPLAGPDGAIDRFLVGNVPIDRSGEVLRPRF
jgi:hypothetical protein